MIIRELNRRVWVLYPPTPDVLAYVQDRLTLKVWGSVMGERMITKMVPYWGQTPDGGLWMYAGHLPRLLVDLRAAGVPFEVHYSGYPFPVMPLGRTIGDVTLRPWQDQFVNDVVPRTRQCIVQMATSAGKSYAMGAIGANFLAQQSSTLAIVPTARILDEMTKKFSKLVPASAIGQFDGRSKDLKPVTIALPTSVAKHLDRIRDYRFRCTLIDECHHAGATTYGRIIEQAPTEFQYSFSASAVRLNYVAAPLDQLDEDEWAILARCGEIGYYEPPGALGEDAVCPFYYYQVMHIGESVKGQKGVSADWQELRIKILEAPSMVNLTVQGVSYLAQTGTNTLVLVPTQKMGWEIVRGLNACGIDVGVAYGQGRYWINQRSVDEAEFLAKNCQADGFRVLLATSLLDEGADEIVQNIHNAWLAVGGGKKERKLLQRLGRTLRPAPGKTYALVFDTHDAGSRVTRNHSGLRLQTARDLKAKAAEIITLAQFYGLVQHVYAREIVGHVRI